MDLYATKQGDCLIVYNLKDAWEKTKIPTNIKKENPKRGKIKKFSKTSKRRLQGLLSKLKRQHLLFVTLTYAENMTDNERAKSDLDNFSREVNRRNKKIWFVWKMEYQERGAIHYHLLVGGSNYKYMKKILNKYWRKGYTNIKIAKKIDLYYFAKYVSKDIKNVPGQHSGRFWGIYNKVAVAYSRLEIYNVSNELEHFLQNIFINRGISNFNSKITIFT